MNSFRRLPLASTATALAALGVMAGTAVAPTPIPSATAGRQEQNSSSRGLDRADATHWGWDNTVPGVGGRPYIKRLAVSNDGGAHFDDLVNPDADASNDWAPSAAVTTVGTYAGYVSDVYAFITPTNGCNLNQHQGVDNCYDTPNRVGISLMRYGGSNTWYDDFTTHPSANPPITDSSIIDLTIGFHTDYSTLRWSWANGVPSYWASTVSPLADGEVRIKFTPKTVPFMTGGLGCSQIPVNTCDIAQATLEYLAPGMILSMDNTLDPALSGTLFGTSSAFIGSLEAQLPSGQSPVLTYGVAAPHNTANGTQREGTFFAFLPSSVLTLFGTSTDAFDSNIFSVARTGDPGTFTPSWTQWNAGANGTDGQLLTISNISFSAPKFVVRRQASGGGGTPGGGASQGGGAPSGGSTATGGSTAPKPLSIGVGKKASFMQIAGMLGLTTTGGKLSATVSTAKVCKVSGSAIKGVKPGSCKGKLTVKRTKGKAVNKGFAFVVTK
jgi:hypothetical protein